MRNEHPVCFDENIRSWGVFTYVDVKRVGTDDQTFARSPKMYTPSKSSANLITRSVHYQDPPEHTQTRDLMLNVLSSREQKKFDALVHSIIEEVFANVNSSRTVDAVSDLAEPIALKIVSTFLGLPEEDQPLLKRWMDSVTNVDVASPDWKSSYVEREFIFEEASRYFLRQVNKRSRKPKEDFISRLLASELKGEKLSKEEIAGNCVLLVLAMDVIKLFLANLVFCLLKHADVLAEVKAKPQMIPSVLEEYFRYLGPTHAITRVVARKVEIGGVSIPAESMVWAWLGSANHDEKVFPDPEKFDPGRDLSQHVSFSLGAHTCPGGPLARILGTTFLSTFVSHATDPKLALDKPLKRLPNLIFYGFERLPFSLGARKHVGSKI